MMKKDISAILKKSTQKHVSINNRSSSVASGTWQIWISFKVTMWTYVTTLEFKLPGNVTTRLKWIKCAQTVEQRKTQPKGLKHKKV